MAANSSVLFSSPERDIEEILGLCDSPTALQALDESWIDSQDAMNESSIMWGRPGDSSHPILITSSPVNPQTPVNISTERGTTAGPSATAKIAGPPAYTTETPEKTSVDEQREILHTQIQGLFLAKRRRELDLESLLKQLDDINSELAQAECMLAQLQE